MIRKWKAIFNIFIFLVSPVTIYHRPETVTNWRAYHAMTTHYTLDDSIASAMLCHNLSKIYHRKTSKLNVQLFSLSFSKLILHAKNDFDMSVEIASCIKWLLRRQCEPTMSSFHKSDVNAATHVQQELPKNRSWEILAILKYFVTSLTLSSSRLSLKFKQINGLRRA